MDTRIRHNKYIIRVVFTVFIVIFITQSYGQSSGRNNKIGGAFNLKLDFFPRDYSEFESVLGVDNIQLMNNIDVSARFEYAITYADYYTGFNFSFHSNEKYTDSIKINFNNSQYGIIIGYNRINSRRFIIRPEFSITWNRERLINSHKDKSISLGTYVSDRNLDLRYNQFIGNIGLNFAYKMYDNNILFTDFWSVGFYFGYAFKFNNYPWIRTKNNRISTDSMINIEKYNAGLYISFNFD